MKTVWLRLNRVSSSDVMDLVATSTDVLGLFRLKATSILGTLWLQTHFADSEWDSLIRGEASFGSDCLNALVQDARSAGLSVEQKIAVES